tara:strand:+ start:55 stop:717 length:663 start_codon:yes stop_codon:yes gene_type:complete
MKIILLSLDNQVGKIRRDKINYDYELYYGVSNTNDLPPEYKDRIHIPYNVVDRDKIMKQRGCCMYGHLNILKRIVNDKLHNVIICEDDAIMKDNIDLNDLEKLNLNEAVLLNAKLHHPTAYTKDKYFNDKDMIFEPGVNDIDFNKFRWSCSACIYYPTPVSAQIIIDFINNNKRLTHFDLLLSKNKVIKKLYYPSAFIISDDGVSQIDKSKGLIDNYVVK